jgi:hypothetical protein
MSIDNILLHPCHGNPPVVNIKHYGSSRKLKIIQLTKHRRSELRRRRERERERREQEPKPRDAGAPDIKLANRLITTLAYFSGELQQAPLTQGECYGLERAFLDAVAKILDDREGHPAA